MTEEILKSIPYSLKKEIDDQRKKDGDENINWQVSIFSLLVAKDQKIKDLENDKRNLEQSTCFANSEMDRAMTKVYYRDRQQKLYYKTTRKVIKEALKIINNTQYAKEAKKKRIKKRHIKYYKRMIKFSDLIKSGKN